MYYERQKAKSEAQRVKPEGTLEGEIRIAMWVLEQRPKLVRAGRDKSPITHSGKKENLSLFPPWFPRQFPSSSSPIAPWSSSRDFLRQNVVPLRLALPRISSGMTSHGMSLPSLLWKVALLHGCVPQLRCRRRLTMRLGSRRCRVRAGSPTLCSQAPDLHRLCGAALQLRIHLPSLC